MSNEYLNKLYKKWTNQPDQHESALFQAIINRAGATFKDDDLAQEFVIGILALLPLADPSNFSAWIGRRLRWFALNDFKRKGRNPEVLASDLPVSDFDGLTTDEERLANMAQQALDNYPDKDEYDTSTISDPIIRGVAKLLLAGFTQLEIASKLGLKPSTLRMKLMRFRNTQPLAT